MHIKTIKFYKNRATGALYGMRTDETDDRLIQDPAKAWERLKKTGKNWPAKVCAGMIIVDFPDEVFIFIKHD